MPVISERTNGTPIVLFLRAQRGPVPAADVVVTMGCGDACPFFPGKRYEDWVTGQRARAALSWSSFSGTTDQFTQRPTFSPVMSPASARILVW